MTLTVCQPLRKVKPLLCEFQGLALSWSMTLKHIHLSSVSDLGPSFHIGWLTHLHKSPFPAAPLFCILALPLSLYLNPFDSFWVQLFSKDTLWQVPNSCQFLPPPTPTKFPLLHCLTSSSVTSCHILSSVPDSQNCLKSPYYIFFIFSYTFLVPLKVRFSDFSRLFRTFVVSSLLDFDISILTF